jgi:chromosome segregation ATPase
VERLTSDLESERERRETLKAGIAAEYEERVSRLRQEQNDLLARFESERGEEAGRREQALADARARIEELEDRIRQKEEKEAELTAYHKAQIAEVKSKFSSLATETAGRDQALTEAQRRIDEMSAQRNEAIAAQSEAEAEVRKAERKLRRMQARQTAARGKLEEQERAIARLSEELATADHAVREAQESLSGMEKQIAAAREEAEKSAVSKVQGEVGELKELLSSLAERGSGPDEATLEALVGRLSERETQLEGRLNVQLDRTLEEINRSLHRATAKPIDVIGEATDVLVGRIFDDEHEMTSNLESLEVQELATNGGVKDSIAQLRAARGEKTEDAS